jgi:transcription elongation GreA/GreB family factor
MFAGPMDADIQKAIDTGKISEDTGRALLALKPGTYCLHKSWGCGRVESLNFLVSQVLIDFKAKKGHPMQFQYAAETLTPLADSHILAKKAVNAAAVKVEAAKDPAAFMRGVLRDLGGQATADQIGAALAPEVFNGAEFKKWWTGAVKALKKDGHFAMPAKKSDPVVLRDAPMSRADDLLEAFRDARQLKAQLAALDEILKNLDSLSAHAEQVKEVVAAVQVAARKCQKLHTREAFELVIARDDIAAATGAQRGLFSLAQLLREEERQLVPVFDALPAARLRRAAAELPVAFGDAWVDKALRIFSRGSAKVVPEIARVLQDNKRHEELRRELDRSIRDHSATTDMLLWLCKERAGEFGGLITAETLGAILSSLEHGLIAGTKKGSRLHDFVLSDKELITDLLAGADADVVRDCFKKVMGTKVFNDIDKRALMGRIIKAHPEMESMLTGGEEQKQASLIVSWESLEKRKAEYEELVNRKIPENVKEISLARSYGDLRENFEYKAAKEMQRVLQRRKAETERDLGRARGTDFANPDTSCAGIGTVVTLREAKDGRTDRFAILGAWDGDPDKGIISYQAATAQALIGRKVGEQVTVPTEHGERTAEIVSIETWKK